MLEYGLRYLHIIRFIFYAATMVSIFRTPVSRLTLARRPSSDLGHFGCQHQKHTGGWRLAANMVLRAPPEGGTALLIRRHVTDDG